MTDPEKKSADESAGEDAPNSGVSSQAPAEGRDDTPGGDEGSPDRA